MLIQQEVTIYQPLKIINFTERFFQKVFIFIQVLYFQLLQIDYIPNLILMSKIFLGLFISLILYFLFAPGPYEAQGFSEMKDPYDITKYMINDSYFKRLKILSHHDLKFPEDPLVEDGIIYAGGYQGKLFKIDKNQNYQVVVQTKGQIMRIVKKGEILYFLDVQIGICRYDISNKNLQILVSSSNYNFLDSFAISDESKIYFSQASSKHDLHNAIYDIFEGKPYGRLFEYDIKTNLTRVLLDNLYFANGVELSPDQSIVYVAQSSRFRIARYYLKGASAGKSDIFVDNLPGAPDNIRFNDKGQMWVALPQLRNSVVDYIFKTTFIRNILGKLPLSFVERIAANNPYTGGLKLNKKGEILEIWKDESRIFEFITTIVEKNGHLYLGTIRHPRIGVVKINK